LCLRLESRPKVAIGTFALRDWGKLMRKLVAATVVAMAMAAPAFAADMPLKASRAYTAPWSWAGLYAGVHGGYGWGSGGVTGSTASGDIDGFFGGGQLGYNWQTGNFVYGIEADLSGGDISNTATGTLGGITLSETDKVNWMGSIRGRLGWAMDRNLFYFTGGYAWGNGNISVSAAVPALGIAASASSSATHNGWVLGGGWETALTPNWTLGVEYQHVSFDSANYFTSIPVSLDVDSVRLKVNYLFH
jgi:outer membrane immunogenic protein